MGERLLRLCLSETNRRDMQGLFISDLHLFSRRSIGNDCWTGLKSPLQKANCLVLGGDIFDFRWSTFPSHSSTLDAACEWLESLIRMHPHLEIIYLTGNHDSHPAMRGLLQDFASSHPQFQWHDHTFQLGDKLFLHGDIIDAHSRSDGLSVYRSKYAAEEESRGKVANFLYDTIVAMRAHHLPKHFMHRPQQIVRRLHACLVQEGVVASSGVHEIYFGHTHVPMSGVVHRGYRFFNPGSAIRHMPFRPCFFKHIP